MDKRIQVYIRNRGQTVCDGEEFKTELYSDREELLTAIVDFVNNTLDYMEEGEDD